MTAISALGVGSGLDLNGLLDQLRQGEEKQLTPIATRKAGYQAKISAFGTLKSALSTFQDAAHALTEKSAFQPVSSSVTGDALTASTSASTPPGSYQIHVEQRAQASSVATMGVADQSANLGAGTITFTLASGDSMSISVDSADSSLEKIRDAINEQDGGVRASIINDGSDQPYRMVLQAADTGSDAAVTNIQFDGDLAGNVQLDGTTHQDGANAKLTINGINIESAHNQVDGAVQGVTMDIVEDGDATLQVTRDDGAIKKDVQNFVDSYNQLVKSLDGLTGYDADTQRAGILLGDSTVRGVESRLRRVLGGATHNGGSFKILTDAGVTLQLDGTLKLDSNKLDKVVTNNLGALNEFFAGSAGQDGLADSVDNMINEMTGAKGLIGSATDGLKQSMERMDQLYDQTQKRIDTTMSRYKSQFSKLDAMIAKMNSTSSYLTKQFAAMGNTSGSGK